MKIWSTKYAMTDGITEHEVDDDGADGMVQIGPCCYLHGEGREWHRTRETALVRAEEMRKAKIASVKKQLAKLESMRFGK